MSQKYEVTGELIVLNETQVFQSGFSKREFVVREQEGKYPQEIKLETVKDGCAKLDAFQLGDILTVAFNLRGNEYNGKHYVSLAAWKVEKTGRIEPGRERSPAADRERAAATPTQPDDETDDIPF